MPAAARVPAATTPPRRICSDGRAPCYQPTQCGRETSIRYAPEH